MTRFELSVPDLSQERLGNTSTPGVWAFESGQPGPTLMISALVHGNELCGAWALKRALQAEMRPRRGRLILAFCNLDAFDTFDIEKHDASRYVDEDLNRVWSTDRLADATTRERQRARELKPWVEHADWLLDLHSMHEPGKPLLLTGTLPRNIALAQALQAPEYVIVDAGHKNGTRMRDFGRFGDPASDALALLIECGFHGDPQAVNVACDVMARVLVESDVMSAGDIPDGWLQPAAAQQKVLEVTDVVVAPSMDFQFASDWHGLDTLSNEGDIIAWADGKPVVAPYDNCTLIMPSLRQLRPGVTVVRLARPYR